MIINAIIISNNDDHILVRAFSTPLIPEVFIFIYLYVYLYIYIYTRIYKYASRVNPAIENFGGTRSFIFFFFISLKESF